MTAPVVPLRPDHAMPAQVTRWPSLLETTGRLDVTTWEALFTEFSRPRRFLGREHPGWSAAVFMGDQRGKERVLRVTAAVLDYDGTEMLGRAVALWDGNLGLLHTSKSHAPDLHRFRVILPLARPVTVPEWDALWPRLNEHAQGRLDGQAKDASRFWYEPGTLDGSAPETRLLTGPPLDPGEWLKRPLRAQPAPVPRQEPRTPDAMQAERRAVAYIARMPPAISGAGGHGATWAVAIQLARGFALSEEATFRILRDEYNPRCQPPWSERELRHKAKQAAAANVTLGYHLERDDHWTPPGAYYAPPEPDGYEAAERAALMDDDEPAAAAAPTATTARPTRSLAEMFAAVLDKAKSGAPVSGVNTCHDRLEETIAGFRPKMITVFGARTSFGKSSYAIMVADEALRKGLRVLLVSVEDSEETYGQRFMARRARVNAYNLRGNRCNAGDLKRMTEHTQGAQTTPFFVDAVGWDGPKIAARIREENQAGQLGLVIVDYIQRVGSGARSSDPRISINGSMSAVCDAIKQCNAGGLILSQLKRPEGGNPNKEPDLHDLKESGDIENMAEHVVLGWVTETGEGDAVMQRRFVKVVKNKDGPVDTRAAPIPFDAATASFTTTRPAENAPPPTSDGWGIDDY